MGDQNMDQGALIDLVRKFRHLYDKRHPDFKNKLARENAWKTICEIMDCPREEVETTWTSFRNKFVTEKRKIRKVPTGSAPIPTRRFFENMQFLEEFVKIRKTEENVLGSQPESQPSWNTSFLIEEASSQEIELGESSCSFMDTSTQIEIDVIQPVQLPKQPTKQIELTPSIQDDMQSQESEATISKPSGSSETHKANIYSMKKNKKLKRDDKEPLENSIKNALNSIESMCKVTDDEDEDVLFGKSIGMSLKHIPDRQQKAKAKIDILQVIDKYDC